MSLTAAQQEVRRTGVGGSEIAALVGLDPRRTPFDVYLAKAEGFELADTPDLERGRFLEPGIANWHAYRTGYEMVETGTIRHAQRPIAVCTPDRLGKRPEHALWTDVSIKAPGPYADGFGEPGSDDVPAHYLLQVQWELGILSSLPEWPTAPVAELVATINGDLAVFYVHRDAEIFEALLDEAHRFWRDHVDPRKPPPLEGSAHAGEWLRRRFPTNQAPLRDASPGEEVLALELVEAEQRLNVATIAYEAAENRMKEAIGEAEGIKGAFGRVTWRATKKGHRRFLTKWRTT